MLFASLTFLIGFLPVALAGAMLSARFFGTRGAVGFLSAASFVFYGWYYPPYVVLLAGAIGVNYLLARRIHRRKSKGMATIAVAVNLGLLGWFKYAGFMAEMVTAISGANVGLPAIVLPLGISFFTFQQIAYLVDIYQGKARPGALMNYVFLISFFPQLIAGPIVHHREVIPQLSQDRLARLHAEDVAAGLLLFCIGLAKKVLLADSLAQGADGLFAAQALGVGISALESWLGMICYTFQIYFDFSGYSDMALGLGLIFGLKLPENFRSPYKSLNIIDFWRRWNITLSTFLRDYLYLPLGGNQKGPVRRYVNLWIVMLLGGLWHGAGLQFVVWGALHGFYLTVNHIWVRHSGVALPRAAGLGLTFVCVVVAWVFFRAGDFAQAFAILRAMTGGSAPPLFALEIFAAADLLIAIVLLSSLIVWFAPNSYDLVDRFNRGALPPSRATALVQTAGVLAAAAMFKLYASGSYAFIYFQF